MLDESVAVVDATQSDNASGADNQQERFSIDTISPDIGHFLAGFALGEGSFMLVCRARPDHRRGVESLGGFQRLPNRRGSARIVSTDTALRNYP